MPCGEAPESENGCYCGSSALSHALLGGGNRFLRVLAQWIALSHAKDHEDFLVEFLGHLIGNRGWGLARQPFHEDGRKLRLAKLATHENRQAFVASCLGEIRLIDILYTSFYSCQIWLQSSLEALDAAVTIFEAFPNQEQTRVHRGKKTQQQQLLCLCQCMRGRSSESSCKSLHKRRMLET